METILDSPDLVERLKADLIATYQPVNAQELNAIERVALAQLSLRNCSLIEAKLVESSLNAAVDPDAEPAGTSPFPFCDPKQLRAWQIFLRYQAQTERLYRRALEDLGRILSQREEESESQPEDIPGMVPALPASLPHPRLMQPPTALPRPQPVDEGRPRATASGRA